MPWLKNIPFILWLCQVKRLSGPAPSNRPTVHHYMAGRNSQDDAEIDADAAGRMPYFSSQEPYME